MFKLKYFTAPFTNNRGTPVGNTGKTVTRLGTKDWVDAGIIAPHTGNISVGIICSSEQANPGVLIWRGYLAGHDHMAEEWTNPDKGKSNLAINTPNTFHRFKILPPGPVNEGDYIGIRIVNLEEGFNLDVAAIYILYE